MVKTYSIEAQSHNYSFITDTDTDYLHVYMPDIRYAEVMFIYSFTSVLTQQL